MENLGNQDTFQWFSVSLLRGFTYNYIFATMLIMKKKPESKQTSKQTNKQNKQINKKPRKWIARQEKSYCFKAMSKEETFIFPLKYADIFPHCISVGMGIHTAEGLKIE